MSHHAHDMRLLSGLVERILHGLAIERQGFVLHAPRLIPGLERPIQRSRVNTDQTIADHKFTGTTKWPCSRRQPKRLRACCPNPCAQSEMAL